MVCAEECWHKSLVPLMTEVRAQLGKGPVYLSFDIDALDPAFAPGTGTPEIAGLTSIQVAPSLIHRSPKHVYTPVRLQRISSCSTSSITPAYISHEARSDAPLVFHK